MEKKKHYPHSLEGSVKKRNWGDIWHILTAWVFKWERDGIFFEAFGSTHTHTGWVVIYDKMPQCEYLVFSIEYLVLLASSSVLGEWFQGLTDPADDALPLRDNWQIAPKMGTMTASLENMQEKPVGGEEIDSKPTGGWTTIFSSAIVINWTKLRS